MKLASVLSSSQMIVGYLLSAPGNKRMNTLEKMFQAMATKRIQKTNLISSFAYKNWYARIIQESMPPKHIYIV